MASLFTLLLLATAPESAAAAPPPVPQARVIGAARARILAPVRISASAAGDAGALRFVTHSQPRRDGARVIDCY